VNFIDRFSKNSRISNSMKICPERAELFHADGKRYFDGRMDRQKTETDITKLIVAFRNVANVPKKILTSSCCPLFYINFNL
jgi:hypothetical protein